MITLIASRAFIAQYPSATSFSSLLFIVDMFHPIGGLAIELFNNRNMSHRCGWHGAMPVFFTRRTPDYIPEINLFDLTTPVLYSSMSRGHDQSLSEWVTVPRRSGTGLECHTCHGNTCRSR